MSDVVATSPHPGGLLVRRGAFSAAVLRGNAPAGALWMDPAGHWRAALGARAALAVSGEPDEESLWAMEGRAPSFRRFAEARDWLFGMLGDGGGAPAAPPSGGTDPGGGDAGRGGGSRGQVVQLAARRAPPRRR